MKLHTASAAWRSSSSTHSTIEFNVDAVTQRSSALPQAAECTLRVLQSIECVFCACRISLHFEQSVHSVDFEDRTLTVQTSSGELTHHQYDLLIAADGRH